MGGSNNHIYNKDYSEKWSFEGYLLLNQRQISYLEGKLKFFEENNINKYMNMTGILLDIKKQTKNSIYYNKQSNFNLNANLINQSMIISKDQIKYQIQENKDISFRNYGYLKKGELIFDLMENNNANIIGYLITRNNTKINIQLTLKNEYKKNNYFQIKDIFYDQKLVYKIDDSIEKISNNLIGFINLGNTCYINSSLQILFHIPGFIEII